MTLASHLRVWKTSCASSRTCSTTCALIRHFGVKRQRDRAALQSSRLFRQRFRPRVRQRRLTINCRRIPSSVLPLHRRKSKSHLLDLQGQLLQLSKWQNPMRENTKNNRLNPRQSLHQECRQNSRRKCRQFPRRNSRLETNSFTSSLLLYLYRQFMFFLALETNQTVNRRKTELPFLRRSRTIINSSVRTR